MALIVIITIVLYALVIIWTWNSLGKIKIIKKVLMLGIGMLMMCCITFVIFNLSKEGVKYDQQVIEQEIKKILVVVFTGVNSLIILPYFAKLFEKLQAKEIEQKQVGKKIIIMIIIFIVGMFLECGYMKDVQQGILEISHSYSTQNNQ